MLDRAGNDSRTMLPVVRVVPLRTVNERLPARYYLSPWKIKLKETQEIAGKKTEKPLKRQQPERKEKYRERQCRANREQHHKLSKLSARHDTQRQRSECLTPMHSTASTIIARWDLYGLMSGLRCASGKTAGHPPPF